MYNKYGKWFYHEKNISLMDDEYEVQSVYTLYRVNESLETIV